MRKAAMCKTPTGKHRSRPLDLHPQKTMSGLLLRACHSKCTYPVKSPAAQRLDYRACSCSALGNDFIQHALGYQNLARRHPRCWGVPHRSGLHLHAQQAGSPVALPREQGQPTSQAQLKGTSHMQPSTMAPSATCATAACCKACRLDTRHWVQRQGEWPGT